MTDWLPRDIAVPASDAEREAVRHVQRALRITETGELDPPTRAALRGIQGLFRITVTGSLDRATAAAIDRLHPAGL